MILRIMLFALLLLVFEVELDPEDNLIRAE